MRKLTYKKAITEAIKLYMERDKSVFVYGPGVDDAEGIFGTGVGLSKFFGNERVFDVPVSENALTGIGIGAAMVGMKPILVHQRIDFTLLTMDQLINHASKYHYMYGGNVTVPFVVRSIVGRGWGQGSQHSQSFHSIFSHFPGLKVILPSNAYDAKGLLITAIKDKNPVMCIEHKFLMNNESNVPKKFYSIPFGKGKILKKGKDVTVVALSLMVPQALEAANKLIKDKINLEIIDLRTAYPLDEKIIIQSVKKTGRLIICDIDWINCGISSEIAARISEKCFNYLKSPIQRIGLPAANHPSSYALENVFFPSEKNIIKIVKKLIKE
tara:strand:+ start:378 stop:1355 length:978 start_codon:yes stop_codon:yes gene_type:complete